MTYLKWLVPIESHDCVITCFCKILWLTKIVMNVYGNQLRQGGNIHWRFSFHKVTRSFNHVVLQGNEKYFTCFITTITRPMVIKTCKMVIYYMKLQTIKPHKPLNTWSLRSNDKIITFYLYYNNIYCHQTCEAGNRQWAAFFDKLLFNITWKGDESFQNSYSLHGFYSIFSKIRDYFKIYRKYL